MHTIYILNGGDVMKFIPQKKEKELISFRIEKELLSEIDVLASKCDLSRNEFMTQCLRYAISNMQKNSD